MTMKKHRARQRHNAMNTDKDDDDQRRLRTVVCQELEDVLHKHDCGGVVFVASKRSSSWRFVLPLWGGIVIEGPGALRVRISSRTPALREVADQTMHYVADMRDMLAQSALMFMQLYDEVVEALGGPDHIEHAPAVMSGPDKESN